MTFPPPMEEEDERLGDFVRGDADVVDLDWLRDPDREAVERTGGAGGPPAGAIRHGTASI